MLTAQKKPSRTITQTERENDSLYMYSEYGILKISPKNEYIVRVTYAQKDDISTEKGIGITYDDAYSNWSYDETDKHITVRTLALTIQITKETGSIKYFDEKETLLLAERDYESRVLDKFKSYKTVIDEHTKVDDIETADGVKRSITKATRVFDKDLYRTRMYLDWQDDEALFGLGQAEEGVLNLRGTTQYIHQANLKIAVPFLLSVKGYGILLATGAPAIFNDTEFGSYLYTEADTQMDFYFIAGDNFDKIIKGYRLLSGKAVMLPKWAFGYMQSQERYETEEELISIVEEYRKRDIGLDTIVLDWITWPDNMWGQKTFDEKRFSNPLKMTQKIHDMNAHVMMSIWPSMDRECDNYKEFDSNNLLLPASNIYDAFNEEAQKMYWEQVNRGLFSNGIDAWWCDSSEPITPEWSCQVKPEPSILYNQFKQEMGNFVPLEKTNSFCLAHAQGIYQGQRSVTEEKRVLNLTRSGYTGQQKYGTVLWSGDIYASWENFKKQIVAGLNFCASGLPYWTLDIGAFFVKEGDTWFWSGKYDNGNSDLGYRELYTRWFQYGAFLPIFRTHGTDVRREVWAFGDKGDMFYESLVSAIKLRYQLMPYIYSQTAMVWYDDSTFMRMLAFDFSHDKTALTIKDQFMFGKNMMICPVTTPMYYEVNSQPIENADYTREVYLPKGTKWYDFWTNEVYEGGNYITVSADITKIPIFVKEGSIIPTTMPMNYVDENPNADIKLLVYPGKDAEFMLYNDSGDGYMYEKGDYSLTHIIWNDEKKEISYENVKENRIYDRNLVVNVIN